MYEYDPKLTELLFTIKEIETPTQGKLTRQTPHSQSTISRQVNELIEDGYVDRAAFGYRTTPIGDQLLKRVVRRRQQALEGSL